MELRLRRVGKKRREGRGEGKERRRERVKSKEKRVRRAREREVYRLKTGKEGRLA